MPTCQIPVKKSPLVIQHVVGVDKGGPLSQLQLVLGSSLNEKYNFKMLSQERASGGLNLSILKEMVSKLREWRPDAIHIRGLHAGGFHAILAAKLARVPRVLVSVHGMSCYSPRQGLKLKARGWILRNLFEPLTLRWADGVVCVCRYTAQLPFIRRHARNHFGVVHNGIPILPFAATNEKLRCELGYAPGDVVALFVGRIVREKGLTVLAQAMDLLEKERVLQPRLILAGDGPEMKEVRSDFRTHIETGRVRFLGQRTDIAALHSASDLFVFPTLHENLSNALIEAMHAARPVIATNVGGNPEVVLHNETGYLIPVSDPIALADSLQDLASTAAQAKRQKLGLAGRKRVEAHFSMGRTLEVLDKVYSRLLSPASA